MKICRKKVDGIFIDLQQEGEGEIDEIHMPIGNYAVSYTHLDVYKRQSFL